MLYDITNFLNTGEIPNLFDKAIVNIPEGLLASMKTPYVKEDIISKILEKEKHKDSKVIPEHAKL